VDVFGRFLDDDVDDVVMRDDADHAVLFVDHGNRDQVIWAIVLATISRSSVERIETT